MFHQPNSKSVEKRRIFRNILTNERSNLQEGHTESRIRRIFAEYCSRSTIHGVGYFLDRKRHWIERVWWSFVVAASIILCMYCISELWSQWREDPIILTPDTELQDIRDIPFPAITLCPYIRASAKKFNFTAVYRLIQKLDGPETRNITPDELRFMSVASILCEEDFVRDIINSLPDEYLDDQMFATIKNIVPDFEETFVECSLFGAPKRCDELFHPIITEENLCYTFNSLNLREIFTNQISSDWLNMSSNQPLTNWDLETGYSDLKNDESYPYRTFITGIQASLNVLLRFFENERDSMCESGVLGSNIVFHSPNELPQVDKDYSYIPLSKAVIFAVEPDQIKAVDSIAAYDPIQRDCFFNDERNLQFFRKYTQQNCELECLSNFTLVKCGCVKFSMPRTNGTRICGPAKYKCMENAQKVAYKLNVLSTKCNCLLSCNGLWYNAYDSQADFDLITTFEKMDHHPEYDIKNAIFSSLRVSFKDETYTVIKRENRSNPLEFISNAGALAGLFLGASLLSIVEFIYFFTLRLFLARRDNRRINDIRTAFVRFEPQTQPIRPPRINPIITFTYLP